jgi:hypothetical protein
MDLSASAIFEDGFAPGLCGTEDGLLINVSNLDIGVSRPWAEP